MYLMDLLINSLKSNIPLIRFIYYKQTKKSRKKDFPKIERKGKETIIVSLNK